MLQVVSFVFQDKYLYPDGARGERPPFEVLTGPWVALIDRSETMQDATGQWFRGFEGHLYSSEAVLTEVMYLLNFSSDAQGAVLDFVAHSVVELVPPSLDSVKATKRLMKKYADLPMDYADSTLVALAMETGIDSVIAFDKRDFSVYRLPRNKRFRVMP